MGLFKKRPLARIRRGNTFLGEKLSATAEGYVIYGEYDAEDRKTYYWEEWELRGFNQYDSWIEYDYYTQKIKLYEPLRPREYIDARALVSGQSIEFTTRYGKTVRAVVAEVGVGIVERREGTLTYHVFKGDKVAYADCHGPHGSYTLETYNDKEFDVYQSRILNRAEQIKLLGRVVEPSAWRKVSTGTLIWTIAFLLFLAYGFYGAAKEAREECTPRSSGMLVQQLSRPASVVPQLYAVSTVEPATSPTTQTPSPTTTAKTCTNRSVYGGGGGFGK